MIQFLLTVIIVMTLTIPDKMVEIIPSLSDEEKRALVEKIGDVSSSIKNLS